MKGLFKFSRQRPVGILMVIALFGLVLAGCGQAADDYLQEGEQAPPFELPTAQGGEVSLSDYQGQQPVLLYFHMALG